MSMRAKRILLIALCAIGIPAIVLGSVLYGNTAELPKAKLKLTELMNNNLSYLCDADGAYYDWVELTNTGDSAVSLEGLSLTDDPAEPDAFVFDKKTLAAGEALVVPLTGNPNELRGGYAPFGLGSRGDTVYLYDKDTLLDQLSIGAGDENVSYGRLGKEEHWFATPTPGAANGGVHAATVDGLREACYTGVLISEVCAVSRDTDRTYPTDWVELTNTTSQPIVLTGYRLTEDVTVTGFVFPETVLAAGERLLVYCDKNNTDDTAAPFSLSPYGETLSLLTPEGVLCDRFESGKQRYGITSGRNGNDRRSRVYFTVPTPGEPNGSGLSGYAPAPIVTAEGGYVTDGARVALTVPVGCRVYYTTDGSEPTEDDALYTVGTTLTVTKNTVLRAVAYREGYLPSDVVTRTYLVSEPHEIPVVSVSGDPQALFGAAGAFTDFLNEHQEVAVHTEYFEKDGSKAVTFNSLLRIAGGLSRYNVQKAFSLNLNQTVGQSTVTYPFFEKATTDTFGNLLLRPSGSDWSSAKLRDEFVAASLDGKKDMVIQAVKPVALYINGTYYGLYYLREKRNEAFVSAETGIPEERVEIAKSPAIYESYLPMNADMKELIRYARTHDLTVEEHYRYVTDRVDISSLMTYYVYQTWYGNGDMINNVAYYRDTNGGKWRWIIFDMDWACTAYYADYAFVRQLYEGTGQHTYRNYYDPLMTALLKNDAFSRAFVKLYKDTMKTTLAPDRLLPILNDLAAEIESEIPRQYARYGAPSVTKWNNQLEYMRDFIRGREQRMTEELCAVFSLSKEDWAAL